MAKSKAKFKVVVKNGDYKYEINKKTGQYDSKMVDLETDYDDLGEALAEFLSYATDNYNENALTLTCKPRKQKDKAGW